MIASDEVIIPHQAVINPTELGRHFPESFRVEDTFIHRRTFHFSSGHHAQNVVTLSYQTPGAGGDVLW
jgi:hypothetical protein